MNLYAGGPARFRHAHAVQDSFVFCFIVRGVQKAHAENVAHLVSLW
jgi:hypothetical protein